MTVKLIQTIANSLLNLATRFGAETAEDRNKPSSTLHPQPSPTWAAGDATGLRTFLDSNHGQALSARLQTVAAHVAIEGAKDRANTIHSAGVSAGWNECVRYIHSLSRVSGEQDTGAEPISTHNRHQPEDEAELLERLSP